MPNHEPRGCARGASYSWYLYSANRVKYPLVRGRLLERWRAALKVSKTPVDAWALIQQNPEARRDYQQVRGMGGFVRSSWDEVNQLIAAANVYTIKQHGPDRVRTTSPRSATPGNTVIAFDQPYNRHLTEGLRATTWPRSKPSSTTSQRPHSGALEIQLPGIDAGADRLTPAAPKRQRFLRILGTPVPAWWFAHGTLTDYGRRPGRRVLRTTRIHLPGETQWIGSCSTGCVVAEVRYTSTRSRRTSKAS